jgi:small redox-active disulfide protein 1
MPVKIEVFYSDTCPYCPNAIALVREVSAEFSDTTVEEVNTSTSEGAARAGGYQIFTVPTIVINGKVSFVGLPDKKELIEAVETSLKLP